MRDLIIHRQHSTHKQQFQAMHVNNSLMKSHEIFHYISNIPVTTLCITPEIFWISMGSSNDDRIWQKLYNRAQFPRDLAPSGGSIITMTLCETPKRRSEAPQSMQGTLEERRSRLPARRSYSLFWLWHSLLTYNISRWIPDTVQLHPYNPRYLTLLSASQNLSRYFNVLVLVHVHPGIQDESRAKETVLSWLVTMRICARSTPNKFTHF